MRFLEYLFNSEYSSSMWIYISIFFLTIIFAFLANNEFHSNKKGKNTRYKWFYVISFIIPWIGFVFADTGADTYTYLNIFKSAEFSDYYFQHNSVENGYLLLNALISLFVKNEYMALVILRTLTISIVWISIYTLRSILDFNWAIMAYMSLFYFQGFNLLRQNLAGSLCFLSLVVLIRKKKILAILLAVVAASIHKSAVLFIISLLVYFIYIRFDKLKKIIHAFIVLLIPITILFGEQIIHKFISYSSFMSSRYSTYLTGESTFGIMQFVFWAPIIIMTIFLNRKKLPSGYMTDIYNINFIWTAGGFVISLLGYSIGMLSRTAIFFAFPFIVFVPFYFYIKRNHKDCLKYSILSHDSLSFTMFFYWTIRFILNISELFEVSALYDYHFFRFN